MIEFLFLDMDDTILDFQGGEHVAIRRTLRDFGLEPTEDVLERYRQINRWHWQQLELGTMTRDQVLVGRFRVLFDEMGVPADSAACAKALSTILRRKELTYEIEYEIQQRDL